jgi:hypothetical protein
VSEYQPEHAPPASPPGTANLDDVERIIQQALERQAEQHRQEIAELRAELSAQQATRPVTVADHLVPWHAGGVDGEIAETWSAHDQALANRGEHPLQLARQAEDEQAA